MRYAIIENNVVTNLVVSDAEFAAKQGWVECPDGVDIGWSFDGDTLIPPPKDVEGEWNIVRAKRNSLLAKSDIMVLPDLWAAMLQEKQQAWSAYRQSLRDIPQNFDDPANVVWPEIPE